MASIAHFKKILKHDFFEHIKCISDFISTQELVNAATKVHYHWRDRIWTPAQTIWTFLIQVLHHGSSCREAVALVLAEQAAAGQPVSASADPSAYCQGRTRLPQSIFSYALKTIGQKLQEKAQDSYLWCGRRLWIVDGTSCSMPDTPELQETFGQPDGQKKGCGFPVAKMVAMFCWATGAVLDVAVGPYRSSELKLWHQLWDQLHSGDIVLGDRFYGVYAYFAQLKQIGCDGVFRLHAGRARTIDFRKGNRLGKNDRLMRWELPQMPSRGLSQDVIDALPATLTIRVIRFHVQRPGFRSEMIMVATTLLDPQIYSLQKIAQLYRDRWTVELRIRDIKTTSEMDILRGKSANVIYKEIYMHFLIYNLIRALMWQAAEECHHPLHRLSYAGTMQHLNAMMPYLWLYAGTRHATELSRLLLEWIAYDVLPDRPCRIEPRALKRRPKQYNLLNKPRQVMREALTG